MKIKKYNNSVGIALVITILFLSPSDSFGQFQMANTLVPLTGNDYPITYANDAKGGHHQVTRLSARDSITSQRRQVGMLCTVYNGVTSPVTYQLICADTKAARDNNANWVVFTPGGAASAVAWSSITANPFNITTPLQGQLLSYDGTSSSWLNVNQPTIPLSGFGAATADVLLGGFKISNLADPASAQDAATRNYVDAATLITSTAIAALNADTATIQPRLNNIISSITGKLNISDTAAMLLNYQSAMIANNTNIAALLLDTATIQPRLNDIIASMPNITSKVNISDTAAMLANYQSAILGNNTNIAALITDTATIQPRLNDIIASMPNITSKVNISDTAAMLANYQSAILATNTNIAALITDSATIQPRLDNIISSISGKLNVSDTAAMLANSRNDMNTLLNLKANLISPGFTGNPTAPTTAKGDSSTNLATTAFVSAAVSSVLASGGVLYQGTAADLSTFTGLTWANISAATVLGNSLRGTICALSTTGYTWVACPVIWGEQKFFLSYGGQTYPFIDGIQKRVFPALTTGSVDYQVWIFKTTPDIPVNLIVNN